MMPLNADYLKGVFYLYYDEMTSGRASDTERDFSHLFSAQNADRHSQGFTEHAGNATTTKGYIFTARNSSCRKVMFSQACVKNSVRAGGVHPRQTLPLGRHPRPRQTPL